MIGIYKVNWPVFKSKILVLKVALQFSLLIRLDFDNFVLAQPETTDHQCQDDQFIVSGGSPIPAICGTNSGAHSKCTKLRLTIVITTNHA